MVGASIDFPMTAATFPCVRVVFRQLRLLGATAILALLLFIGASLPVRATDMSKTLRVAFPVDITGLDPQAVNDLYSAHIATAIFDVLWEFDYYARPLRLKPSLAAALPEISPDGLTWIIRIKKGLYFADDPAFNGRKREVTAEDFIYSWKRMLDPRMISPTLWQIDNKIVGANELVAEAKRTGHFDYDKPIEGLKALDRYTIQLKLTRPDYTLTELMLGYNWSPVAREVVERYRDPGGRVMNHPVGAGPFRIKQWVKGSKIVLTKNENYREEFFPTEGEPSDAEVLARNKGKRLPLVGNVEVSIIEEAQPRLLTFQSGALDYEFVHASLIDKVVQGGKLLPEFANRGVRHYRALEPVLSYDFFNMEDPIVGGLEPAKIALRRAIIMAFPVDDYVRVTFRGQAMPANQIIPPTQTGHDPKRPRTVRQDVQLANALLDYFGYLDRDGDGFRDLPDGHPFTITRSSTPNPTDRETDELWKKTMDSLRIRIAFNKQKWPDLLKAARAGQVQFWGLGWIAGATDGNSFVQLLYSRNIGQSNFARFRHPKYDELYERAQRLPIGPQRWALYRAMNDMAMAYSVWSPGVYRFQNVITQPWLLNYKRNPFRQHFWHLMDIDPSKRQ
ncbi:MAG: ABC transporter substrate-binding protein [Casimicrobiaceae bacterium]|nr:ABC transporter substrate-binding protein [Casimicrobiaceae bacterium]MDW8311683.1 ABC transporter substrate-binding protein [Burkholderiales bacterium]